MPIFMDNFHLYVFILDHFLNIPILVGKILSWSDSIACENCEMS